MKQFSAKSLTVHKKEVKVTLASMFIVTEKWPKVKQDDVVAHSCTDKWGKEVLNCAAIEIDCISQAVGSSVYMGEASYQ
jgi:DNA-directed RNA polymerase subunit H (RpoH/RPB5)